MEAAEVPMSLVDEFIADTLLPHTKKTIPCSELYDLFEKYCGYLETPVPHSQVGFGRVVSDRLWRVRRNGRTFYYCEISPRILT